MTATDLLFALPLLVLAATAAVAATAIAFLRSRSLTFALSATGLVLAGVSLSALPDAAVDVTPLLVIDRYGFFYVGLILAASLAVAALTFGYTRDSRGHFEELFVLQILSTLGACVLALSRHLVSFFLGLELLTVPLYVMIAYLRARPTALEAGVKYLILAAASSAFLLFGMALLYAQTGGLQFARLASLGGGSDVVATAGIALIVAGVGFKLAVVPFHMWTPDVYQGAPAPVTAFVATVSKGAMVAVLLRLLSTSGAAGPMQPVLAAIAVASMFAGNLLALLQNNVKRILAYSSIAHLGYLLVGLVASGALAAEATTYYLATYVVTTLGAFGVLSILSAPDREAEDLEAYRGLFWRRPALAATFSAMLLSLAGIPLTAGFVGKFYVVAAGVQSDHWWLVLALVINSAIGLFYYLRVLLVMYARAEGARVTTPVSSWASGSALAALLLALLWIGIYPAPLMRIVAASTAGMAGVQESSLAAATIETGGAPPSGPWTLIGHHSAGESESPSALDGTVSRPCRNGYQTAL
jgi:NADH-quinone oxidoreductase subunit N